MNYWIKQLGLPHDKIKLNDKCDFSRTIDFPERPTGVKIGDQLFVYAVGHKFLYAQLEVLSVPFEGHPEEFSSGRRHPSFPWLLYCRNVNKAFSDHWLEHQLDLYQLAEEYHAQTGALVTKTKGNLNAVNAQKSYFKVQEGFVQYLIQKMASK